MAGELSFIEFGSEDPGKSRRFYEALFGWIFTPGPSGEAAGYDMAGLGTPAGIHGGDPAASPYIFFKVDDLDAAAARVLELGGTVLELDVDGTDEQAATYGRFKMCTDSQGSPFGLHQPPNG
ncbi:VOC family protein [Diaminobutyricimonas sp. TR449]|uniref:VOC family protein n=1 Tax=Diaminobutyricimonas sp. TR449 TaxID=2708076 RepID=UPI0014233BCF|nr:VOC family protein [Diaminobutyricimonas sp. TR449]